MYSCDCRTLERKSWVCMSVEENADEKSDMKMLHFSIPFSNIWAKYWFFFITGEKFPFFTHCCGVAWVQGCSLTTVFSPSSRTIRYLRSPDEHTVPFKAEHFRGILTRKKLPRDSIKIFLWLPCEWREKKRLRSKNLLFASSIPAEIKIWVRRWCRMYVGKFSHFDSRAFSCERRKFF